MSHPEVGNLIDSSAKRDAIHIAIAPVMAATLLQPGQAIGFVEDNTMHVGPCERPLSVGIVDPFLSAPVRPGEQFYMFLHPNTITSLRHEWVHPAFGREGEEEADRGRSEQWLREFLASADGADYDDMMAAIKNDGHAQVGAYASISIDEDYVYLNGMDGHGEIPDEFWDHVEIVTGKKAAYRPQRFTCSC